MKKGSKPVPNQRLREERELRGWSQKYVTDQIGVDPYYLSRWERGTATPSPHYRQKLCALFGKNAKELGLLHEERGTSSESLPGEAAIEGISQAKGLSFSAALSALPGSKTVVRDPAVPLLSAEITQLVGRDEVLSQLRARLCSRNGSLSTALNGLPGVGKTALATALVHDSEVLNHFRDGILWSGLGPQPDILALLSRWARLLGIDPRQVAGLTSIENLATVLRIATGMRHILLVIDDAWDIEKALDFRVGGPRCSYLLTTRFPYIALQFAAEGAKVIQELSEHDSVRLLAQLAPRSVTSNPPAARALVRSVGGLPLALTIIGKHLRAQSLSGQPRRIQSAMERLRNAGERLHLSEPQAMLERSPNLPKGVPVSLQAVIGISEQQLDDQAKQALYALAVFPAKPNSFSEQAALAVCQVPVETLDTLSDAGLLESGGPDRYTLHPTIADYAKIHLIDTSAYMRMAGYFASYVDAHKKDHTVLEQESSNLYAAADFLYGLAQAAAGRGDVVEAKRCGLEGLTIFEVLDHAKASEVKEWLDALPMTNQVDISPRLKPGDSYPHE
jgi:transcriptional regulator with XRE-family HTH domain